jgi:hypothetical protein
MTGIQIVLLIAAVLLFQAVIWFLIVRWIKLRTQTGMQRIYKQASIQNTRFIIEPQPGLYRGSDSKFGNIKGNGVICLTGQALLFEKLTGQRIEIDRNEIVDATVENTFKGKLSVATGGRHLVIRTKDGNRIGFLLKNAALWSERLKP